MVPATGEGDGLVVGTLWCREQRVRQAAVTDDETGCDPQPGTPHLLEEHVYGAREVGAQDQRRRRAGGGKAGHEFPCHDTRVVGRHQPRLLRQGDGVEPFEQWQAQRAGDAHLRVVHVRVDETGQDEPFAQVEHVVVRMPSRQFCPRASLGDDAVDDAQSGVALDTQLGPNGGVAGRGVDEGTPDEGHGDTAYPRACGASSKRSNRSAATDSATDAGSLPVIPLRPIGLWMRRRAASS